MTMNCLICTKNLDQLKKQRDDISFVLSYFLQNPLSSAITHKKNELLNSKNLKHHIEKLRDSLKVLTVPRQHAHHVEIEKVITKLSLSNMLLSSHQEQEQTLKALFQAALEMDSTINLCNCLMQEKIKSSERTLAENVSNELIPALSRKIKICALLTEFKARSMLVKSNKEITIELTLFGLKKNKVKTFKGKDALYNAKLFVNSLNDEVLSYYYDISTLDSESKQNEFISHVRDVINAKFKDSVLLKSLHLISAKDIAPNNLPLFKDKFAKDRYLIQVILQGGLATRTTLRGLQDSKDEFLINFVQTGAQKALNKIFNIDHTRAALIRDFEVNLHRGKYSNAHYDVRVNYTDGKWQQFQIDSRTTTKPNPKLILDSNYYAFATDTTRYTHQFFYLWSSYENRIFKRQICKFGLTSIAIDSDLPPNSILKRMKTAVNLRLKDYADEHGLTLRSPNIELISKPELNASFNLIKMKELENKLKEKINNSYLYVPEKLSTCRAKEVMLCTSEEATVVINKIIKTPECSISMEDISKLSRKLNLKSTV